MTDRGCVTTVVSLTSWAASRLSAVPDERERMSTDLDACKASGRSDYQLDWELRVRSEELARLETQLVHAKGLLEEMEDKTVKVAGEVETAIEEAQLIDEDITALVLGLSKGKVRKPLSGVGAAWVSGWGASQTWGVGGSGGSGGAQASTAPSPSLPQKPGNLKKNAGPFNSPAVSFPTAPPQQGTDIFRVEKKNYSSPGYAETAASTPSTQTSPLPQVRFVFRGDSRRKETCVFLEAEHKEEISRLQSQVDEELRERCEKEIVNRKSAEEWLSEESDFFEREKKASEGVVSQIVENCIIRRECWKKEKLFFDDLLTLIDKRNATEIELNKMITLSKRSEKQRSMNGVSKTNETLAEIQINEQSLKRKVESLQTELTSLQTQSKSELQKIQDESEKYKIRTRQSFIRRKQEIDGMANDVKLLAQRVLRVREGIKKYDISHLTDFQDIHPLLASLERIAIDVEALN